jgi:hypothetical protein
MTMNKVEQVSVNKENSKVTIQNNSRAQIEIKRPIIPSGAEIDG